MAPQDSENCGQNFAKRGLTLDPAGMHCPSWDDAFVSSFFLFVCHAPCPDYRAFEGCIVRTSFPLPLIDRFRRGFQHFFSKGSALSDALLSSHIRR